MLFGNVELKGLKDQLSKLVRKELYQVDNTFGMMYKSIDEDLQNLSNMPAVTQADETISTYLDGTKDGGYIQAMIHDPRERPWFQE